MILATSPIYFRGNGMAMRRAVLRMKNDGDFVVHDQYIHLEGGTTFGNGDYFSARNADAFQKAHARFLKRCEEYLQRTIGEDATDRLAPLEVLRQFGAEKVTA